MSLRLRAIPAALLALTLVAEAGAVALAWGAKPHWDTVLYVVYATAMSGAGALIVSRHPRHPVGWCLVALALVNTVAGDLAQGYGLRAAGTGWSGGTLAEWIVQWSFLPQGILLVLTFLLFPDGHLLAPRWAAVAWVAVAGAALAAPGWALSPGAGPEFSAGVNPYAVEALPTGALFSVGLAVLASAMVASLVPMVARFRRSTGIERQQVMWVALAAGAAIVVLPLGAALWYQAPVVRLAIPLALAALPVSMCVAILRYRLYDIDLVVGRTVAYGALSLALAGTYATTAVVIGAVAGLGSAWATAGATLAVAAAFGPLRRRLQDAVDRRFNRARFDARQQVARFLEELRAGGAAPEDVEQVLRRALATEELDVRLLLPGSGRNVDLSGAPVTDEIDEAGDGRRRWPIRHADTTVGTVVAPAGLARRGSLVPELLDAAALAVEVARLRVELRRRLGEVEASRARIVTAADDERRRIERDLHDGAQQRLVSIGLTLRHAQHALGPSAAPEVDRTLDDAVAEITVAIDELRDLAGGLRPAQLDAGLGPALRDLASRAPLPVEVDTAGERFPVDLETAAWFCACEGLTNSVKHARATKVRLSARRHHDRLVLSVVDDGIGGAAPRNGSGLTGLSDRVAARGGTLSIDSEHGRGTTLVAEFPCVS